MKLKKIIAAATVAVAAFMPTCFAEDWVYFGSYAGSKIYVDMDTAWYQSGMGGFIEKVTTPEGNAACLNEKFKEYQTGVDLFQGTLELFDSSGNRTESRYIGKTKFYERGKNAWIMCMAVKEHCGY